MKKLLQLSLLLCLSNAALWAQKDSIPTIKVRKKVERDTVSVTNPPNNIFTVVEQMPRFYADTCENNNRLSNQEKQQCANKAMFNFIYRNIRYPDVDRLSNNQGTVIIRFIVTNTGFLDSISVLKTPSPTLGTESVRIVELMRDTQPRWVPGTQRGQAVNVPFNLPIRFKLN